MNFAQVNMNNGDVNNVMPNVVFVVLEGECCEGKRLRGVFSTMERAMECVRKCADERYCEDVAEKLHLDEYGLAWCVYDEDTEWEVEEVTVDAQGEQK